MSYFCNGEGYFCNVVGPYSESVVKNPTRASRGFYSSIRLGEVFHVKTLCLLFYLRNYFVSDVL